MVLKYKVKPDSPDDLFRLLDEIEESLSSAKARNKGLTYEIDINEVDSVLEVKVLDIEESVN
jgi:hypothetical protein